MKEFDAIIEASEEKQKEYSQTHDTLTLHEKYNDKQRTIGYLVTPIACLIALIPAFDKFPRARGIGVGIVALFGGYLQFKSLFDDIAIGNKLHYSDVFASDFRGFRAKVMQHKINVENQDSDEYAMKYARICLDEFRSLDERATKAMEDKH